MRYFPITFAVVVCCFFSTVPARAVIAWSYTEESYAFLATDIFEATIGERIVTKNSTTVQATVNKVYKGGHQEADTVTLADLDGYSIQVNPDDINSRELAKGDKVLLFLVPARAGFMPDAPEGQNILVPLDGGLYTIKPDGMHASYQWSNPGGYEDVGHPKMTPAEFRTNLAKEVVDMAQLQVDIKTKKLPAEIDWFVAELKKRNVPAYLDMISPIIAKRVTDTRDPALIVKAAVATGGYKYQLLINSLNFSEGREYAVIQITDPMVSLSTRLMLARALPTIGVDYYFDDPMPASISDADKSNNHHLITRLAEIARQPGAPSELIECVLENLWQAYPSAVRTRLYVPSDDRDEALKLLRPIHDQPATAEPVKFYIEALTLRADRDAYLQLHSPCGDVPTLVTLGFPSQPLFASETRPGMFNIEIHREKCGLAQGTQLPYTIIATNLDTSQQYTLYSEEDPGGDLRPANVAFPPEAPGGPYKIQYMTVQSDKKIYGYGLTMSVR